MDEDKKRMAGLCSFTLVTLFSTAAFLCGLYATGFCSFVARDIELTEAYTNNITGACRTLGIDYSSCQVFMGKHGVGFYAWQGMVPVNQTVCLSYTQYVPGIGYVTPDFDTKFNSAKALAITASVMGGFAWFTLMFTSCCPISQRRLKGLAFYFFLATLFQGLTFLIMKSNVCSKGFFKSYFVNTTSISSNFDDVVADVSCSLDTGSKLSVSATVLYFLCNCLIPAAIAPKPVMYGADEDSDEPAQPTRDAEEQPEAENEDK